MTIGEKLRQLREGAHVSRGELAQLTGVRENHIQKIETGWTSQPGYKTLGILLDAALQRRANHDEWVADDFQPYKGTDASAEVFQGKVARVRNEQDREMKLSELVPVKSRYKVLRGGSWKGDPFSTATYHRDYAWPNYASDFYGFRCASDLDK